MKLTILLLACPLLAVDYFTIRTGTVNVTTAGNTPWATVSCAAPVEATGVIPTGGAGGDRVTICNGHTLTNPVGFSWPIGDSSTPGTLGLRAEGTTGTGILVNNGSLTVRANVQSNASAWTSGPGSSITFDNATILVWQIGGAAAQANAALFLNGSVGSRVPVSSSVGGAAGRFSGAGLTCGGRLYGQYFDLDKIGDAANSITAFLISTTCPSQTWENFTANNTGGLSFGLQLPGAAVHRLKNGKFTNTARSFCVEPAGLNAMTGGGERLIENFSCDKRWGDAGGAVSNFTFRNVYFGDGWVVSTTRVWATMTNIFMVSDDNVSDAVMGELKDSYILADVDGSTPIGNAKPLQVTGNTALNFAFSGNIYEGSAVSADPDGLAFVYTPASASHISMEGNLTLKEGTGNDTTGSCGTLTNASSNTNFTLSYESNTCYVGAWGFLSENNPGVAGQITSIQRNIFWDDQAPRGHKYHTSTAPGSTVTDIFAPANGNWNNGFNILALDPLDAYTNEGNGYISNWSVTPGANDVSIDPKFCDTTRRITTWDAMLGGAGTYASARTRIANGVADGSVQISTLVNWVRQGYAPCELRMANPSADGTGYLGAVKPHAKSSGLQSAGM